MHLHEDNKTKLRKFVCAEKIKTLCICGSKILQPAMRALAPEMLQTHNRTQCVQCVIGHRNTTVLTSTNGAHIET